jgi:hypothetical protein
MMADTLTLWRPTGPEELALVRASGWRRRPPRPPEQPIFYPVLNEAYAVKITRGWNLPASGSGYVTRFAVDAGFAARHPVRQVGGRDILELWVPAEEPDGFNDPLGGLIEVVHEFHGSTVPRETKPLPPARGGLPPGRVQALRGSLSWPRGRSPADSQRAGGAS